VGFKKRKVKKKLDFRNLFLYIIGVNRIKEGENKDKMRKKTTPKIPTTLHK